MYQKNCDRCQRPSFSSCEQGEWLCPVCGNDLTLQPFFNAMTQERVNVSYKIQKQKKQETLETRYTLTSQENNTINIVV